MTNRCLKGSKGNLQATHQSTQRDCKLLRPAKNPYGNHLPRRGRWSHHRRRAGYLNHLSRSSHQLWRLRLSHPNYQPWRILPSLRDHQQRNTHPSRPHLLPGPRCCRRCQGTSHRSCLQAGTSRCFLRPRRLPRSSPNRSPSLGMNAHRQPRRPGRWPRPSGQVEELRSLPRAWRIGS